MLSIIINITGLFLIIIGLFIIRKDFKKNNIDDLNLVENRVKEYHDLTEETINDFLDIIDHKLEKINETKIITDEEKESTLNNKSKILIDEGNYNNENIQYEGIHKVLELYNIGLNSEEIAKRLNKSKREIEIILKIYKDKNIGKTN